MTQLADPRVEFEKRWAYQALESAIARREPTILYRGPRGCAKTLNTAYLLYEIGLRYPGTRQVWARWERTDLTDTVIRGFEEEILGLGHPLRGGPARETRQAYDLGRDSVIMLTGLRDPQELRSMGADILWYNEVNDCPEGHFEEFGGALRKTVASQCPYRVILGDFNPCPPQHWTNQKSFPYPERLYPSVPDNGTKMGQWFTRQMYLDTTAYNLTPMDRTRETAKLIVGTFPDNPGYWDFEKWDWLPPGLEYVRDRLGIMTGSRRAAFLEGRPAAAEGTVFQKSFIRDRHSCPPFKVSRDLPCFLAEDPGHHHPTAIVVVAVSPMFILRRQQNGQLKKMHKLYIVGEIVRSGSSIAQDARDIQNRFVSNFRIVKMLGDPHMMFNETKHSSGVTIAAQMADHGLRFQKAKAASNPVQLRDQVEDMRDYLESFDQFGEPMLQIFDTCVHTINAFLSWPFATTAKGEIKGSIDTYGEYCKDPMDAVRMVTSWEPQFVSSTGAEVESRGNDD